MMRVMVVVVVWALVWVCRGGGGVNCGVVGVVVGGQSFVLVLVVWRLLVR